jgi:hypothetical protein
LVSALAVISHKLMLGSEGAVGTAFVMRLRVKAKLHPPVTDLGTLELKLRVLNLN